LIPGTGHVEHRSLGQAFESTQALSRKGYLLHRVKFGSKVAAQKFRQGKDKSFLSSAYKIYGLQTSVLNLPLSPQVSPDRSVHDIHTELVNRGYLMYEMQHVGGISVNDDRICWSAFDCIYCGRWDGQQVSDIKMELAKGQASEVCQGELFHFILIIIVNLYSAKSIIKCSKAICKLCSVQQSKIYLDNYL
jgi:hypothetical protein